MLANQWLAARFVRGRRVLIRVLPPLILVAAVLLALRGYWALVGPTEETIRDDQTAREQVVALVLQGELGPPGDQVITPVPLPSDLRDLSAAGRIYLTRLGGSVTVVFVTVAGVVDQYEGYAYSSEDTMTDDPLGGGRPSEITRIKPGWFRIIE
jgi:hypothetical protein